MQLKTFTIIVCVLLMNRACLMAQYQFAGTIYKDHQQPLPGASIAVDDSTVVASDSSGHFEFSNPLTQVKLRVSHIGFVTFTASYTNSISISISLQPSGELLEAAIIKAYESNRSLLQVPASIAILNRAALERFDNSSLLPAINTVPGVKMDERSPGSYRLSIRGNLLRSPFGVRNVKVYWNGIPFTDANGNTYLNQIDLSNVGSMEIIKGPGGSMYGAGTGGVVLLNGRVANANEKSIVLNGTAGSYATYQGNVAYRQSSNNSNSVLQYSHQQSDGWRNHTNMRRDVANYTGSFNISKQQTLHGNLFYSDLYYQTPGGLTAAQVLANPRQARPAGAFGSAEDQQAALFVKTFYAGLAHEYHFDSAWSNTTSVYTSSTRFRNPAILNYQRKTEQGIGGRSVTQYRNDKLTIVGGGEYQYGFTSSRTFGNKRGVPDTLQLDDEIGATQFNLFLQADWSITRQLSLSAGLSYNNYQYGFVRLNQLPVNSANRTFDPLLVPRISLLGRLNDHLSVYGTFSKGYSPPTIDELVPSTGVFNPTLEAEKATNYEVGLKGELIRNKLIIDASAYLLQLGNTIVTRRDNSGADYFVNTGNTNQKGIELSVNYYAVRNAQGFLQELKLWGNYTFINARFASYQQGNNNFTSNKLTGTPGHVVVAGADMETKVGWYVHGTYSYTDVIPLNDANGFYSNAYNLLFVKTGIKHRLGKKLGGELFAAFNKSFNVPYGLGNDLNAAGNRFFNPSAPQNFSAGIQLNFIL